MPVSNSGIYAFVASWISTFAFCDRGISFDGSEVSPRITIFRPCRGGGGCSCSPVGRITVCTPLNGGEVLQGKIMSCKVL